MTRVLQAFSCISARMIRLHFWVAFGADRCGRRLLFPARRARSWIPWWPCAMNRPWLFDRDRVRLPAKQRFSQLLVKLPRDCVLTLEPGADLPGRPIMLILTKGALARAGSGDLSRSGAAAPAVRGSEQDQTPRAEATFTSSDGKAGTYTLDTKLQIATSTELASEKAGSAYNGSPLACSCGRRTRHAPCQMMQLRPCAVSAQPAWSIPKKTASCDSRVVMCKAGRTLCTELHRDGREAAGAFRSERT
jgi:hypothetical protein